MDSEAFSLNFLTPSNSIRGQRARSMLATTRDSKNNVQSTISNIEEWSPEEQNTGLTQPDDQFSSINKQRSNSRKPTRKSRLPAPSVFRNCAFCGAFFINVSTLPFSGSPPFRVRGTSIPLMLVHRLPYPKRETRTGVSLICRSIGVSLDS